MAKKKNSGGTKTAELRAMREKNAAASAGQTEGDDEGQLSLEDQFAAIDAQARQQAEEQKRRLAAQHLGAARAEFFAAITDTEDEKLKAAWKRFNDLQRHAGDGAAAAGGRKGKAPGNGDGLSSDQRDAALTKIKAHLKANGATNVMALAKLAGLPGVAKLLQSDDSIERDPASKGGKGGIYRLKK